MLIICAPLPTRFVVFLRLTSGEHLCSQLLDRDSSPNAFIKCKLYYTKAVKLDSIIFHLYIPLRNMIHWLLPLTSLLV